jgi:8-oxo-dGTP pyrophosphatase MutT (NUDIX family)
VQAFLVDVEPGWEPALNEEHDEYRWLDREEAAELLFWPEPAALLRSLP